MPATPHHFLPPETYRLNRAQTAGKLVRKKVLCASVRKETFTDSGGIPKCNFNLPGSGGLFAGLM